MRAYRLPGGSIHHPGCPAMHAGSKHQQRQSCNPADGAAHGCIRAGGSPVSPPSAAVSIFLWRLISLTALMPDMAAVNRAPNCRAAPIRARLGTVGRLLALTQGCELCGSTHARVQLQHVKARIITPKSCQPWCAHRYVLHCGAKGDRPQRRPLELGAPTGALVRAASAVCM